MRRGNILGVAASDETPPRGSGAASTRRIGVLCVDDSTDMTTMMQLILDSESDMHCLGCLKSADRLVAEVRTLMPDVVLLDASMAGKVPFDAMRELASEVPQVRTVVVSGHDDEAFVGAAMSAGAWGCVSKRDEPDTIVRAVREVAAGRFWLARTSG